MTASVLSGRDLAEARFPPVTARDVLEAEECDPACLLALGDVEWCQCKCNGYYHGVMADERVEGHA